MTIGRGVEWVRQAQAEGVDVIAETCPHYLVLTKFDHDKVGHLAKVNPPLRDERNQELLWEGIRDGTVTCVGSDHSTIVPRPDKLQKDIWTPCPASLAMGMLLPDHAERGLPQGPRLARALCRRSVHEQCRRSTASTRRRVRSEVGSDADFAIVDLDQERVVTPEYMQSSPTGGSTTAGSSRAGRCRRSSVARS